MRKLIVIFILTFCTEAFAFTPTDKIMPLSQLKTGAVGYAKTVLKGTKVSSFKVKILGILPSKRKPKNFILIRVEDEHVRKSGGIAEGMSGSPVYVDGKLIGAIGYGWSFSDNNLGLVTPVEDMMRTADRADHVRDFSLPEAAPETVEEPEASPDVSCDVTVSEDVSVDVSCDAAPAISPVFIDGVSERFAQRIGKRLNRRVMPFGACSGGQPAIVNWKAEPGTSIGVALAWGDVTVGGIGTLTALSKDGRFIAFAHPMEGLGDVAYALTNSAVLQIIPGIESSFKLGYLGDIVGTVTQDRPEAIAGQIGRFAPAASYTVNFTNVDTGERIRKRFQTVYDPHTSCLIAPPAILGLIDSMWEQTGAGTASITYTVSGGNSTQWRRRNIFVSDKDIVEALKKEIEQVIKFTALNPFRELWPYGVNIDVNLSCERRVSYIQKIEIEDEREFYRAGDTIKLAVTLREWRQRPVIKHFKLVVPKDSFAGCIITARGGGIGEPDSEALENGARAIETYDQYMAELSASESNNQLIVEIDGPKKNRSKKARSDKKAKKDDDKSSSDYPSPEDRREKRLVSEIQTERTSAHEMIIENTDYYIEGKLHKMIKVKHPLQDALESGDINEILALLEQQAESSGDKTRSDVSKEEDTPDDEADNDEDENEEKEDSKLHAIPKL